MNRAAGIWGIAVTISLVRGSPTTYRNALLILFIGALSAGIQMAVSQSVRGSSAPVNMRFYVTLFTLTIFLLLRLPPLWQRVDITQSLKGDGLGGASVAPALIVCSAITLTTPLWAGPSHVSSSGSNWVDSLQVPLQAGGWGMMLGGIVALLAALDLLPRRSELQGRQQPSHSKM